MLVNIWSNITITLLKHWCPMRIEWSVFCWLFYSYLAEFTAS